MRDAIFPPAPRQNIPTRERNSACARCGWPPFSGIHLPALTGPRQGEPWEHAYVAPIAGVPGTPETWTPEELAAAKKRADEYADWFLTNAPKDRVGLDGGTKA